LWEKLLVARSELRHQLLEGLLPTLFELSVAGGHPEVPAIPSGFMEIKRRLS
jgi:hypothetical protein